MSARTDQLLAIARRRREQVEAELSVLDRQIEGLEEEGQFGAAPGAHWEGLVSGHVLPGVVGRG
ncbi:hypothetical protein KIH74_22820 [Kineosporia sp. J2-2]|uniref:Uncharacterized protein n=1 Tax=Kineosporia corallincola TaxID=2835133 RepID=A0ABS5TL13_9ACTN|nr:hypothetical protein [Kineosporia corallincola]MBT0771792.1 hypothetical protein [Kineosporia corallincola]